MSVTTPASDRPAHLVQSSALGRRGARALGLISIALVAAFGYAWFSRQAPIKAVEATARLTAAAPVVPPAPARAAAHEQSARIAELDAALAIEGRDPAREHEVLEAVREALEGDPARDHVEAACGKTFCRLQIDKPVGVGMGWREIEDALRVVATGETILQTEAGGRTAYVYFADGDAHLPL